MNQAVEFFRKLFDTSDWPPCWHCGNWTDFHGWLYIISDLLIWSAYFAIPLLILSYVRRQRKVVCFNILYFLFAAFILACGTTHLLDAIIFWVPAYRVSALVRFLTGVLSWTTVYFLVKLLPTAFSLKSAKELEAEVLLREQAEVALQKQNKLLNESQQMASVGSWEWDIHSDKVVWSDEQYRIWGRPLGSEVDYNSLTASIHPETMNCACTPNPWSWSARRASWNSLPTWPLMTCKNRCAKSVHSPLCSRMPMATVKCW